MTRAGCDGITSNFVHRVAAGFGAGRLGRELVGTILAFILLWWMLGHSENLLP